MAPGEALEEWIVDDARGTEAGLARAAGLACHASAGPRGWHEAEAASMHALADSMSSAALLLDDGHRVLWMNQAAGRLLARRDAFSIDAHGLLRIHDADGQVRLRELLRGPVNRRGAHRQPAGVRIARYGAGRPYWVEASRLPRPGNGAADRQDDSAASVLLCILDPERKFGLDAPALEDALGLTPAEARLTVCLVQGATLREAADSLAIAESTARFVAKLVLSKTGCRRQAELVRLVLCLSH